MNDLTACFDLSQPAASQHPAALKKAGPVNGQHAGRRAELPGGAVQAEAARRLDRALPRVLDWEHVDRLEELLEKMDE